MTGVLQLWTDRVPTPIGEMVIVVDDEGRLRAMDWVDLSARMDDLLRRQYGRGKYVLTPAKRASGVAGAIGRYFGGDLGALDDVRVETGGTAFQREVWRALREVPCGATVSYGELARRIGRPSAVRAVGLANGANPVPIVVPCHRAIGADGSLTGYGGGMDRKRWLLEHERRAVREMAAVG